MNQSPLSVRPFIGAKNFKESCNFYKDVGFTETVISPVMSLFTWGKIGFYLQDYYLKDWIDNTMVFIEVADAKKMYDDLLILQLPQKYKNVKLVDVRVEHWGRECFLYDPSGVLWHFGEFF